MTREHEQPNPALWRGRRVFVTGHTGFTGGWMCRVLLERGATVMGYSLAPPSEPNLFDLTNVRDEIDHRDGDVRDLPGLTRAVRAFDPHVVMHLAAQTLVLESYREPVATFATNVMGTVHVLEALRAAACAEACVIVTSDKCYENRELDRGYREDDPMGGSDPYSASKGCAELVSTAFRRSYFSEGGARVASARAGNVIGGGDWADDRLVPDIVRALVGGSPLTLRHGDSVRPWQHVLEPVSGYLALAERLVSGQSEGGGWNFGPADGDVWTVRQVVEAFFREWGAEAPVQELAPSELTETRMLVLDSGLARRELGWRSRWSVEEAVGASARWYRAFYADPSQARALVERDLAVYFGAADGA
jgi:CDP-glucose 4,6-dehydratase